MLSAPDDVGFSCFFCFNLPSRGCVMWYSVWDKGIFFSEVKNTISGIFLRYATAIWKFKKWIVAGCLSCFDWKINSIFDFWNWFAFKKPKPIFFFTWIRVCVLVSKMMVGQRGQGTSVLKNKLWFTSFFSYSIAQFLCIFYLLDLSIKLL